MSLKQYCLAGSHVFSPQGSPPSGAPDEPLVAELVDLVAALVEAECSVCAWPEHATETSIRGASHRLRMY
jgi:hypothetical protein